MVTFNESAAWLGQQLLATAGRPVAIEQGATILEGINGILAAASHDVVDARGNKTKVRSADWTFVAADLGELVFRNGTVISDAAGNKWEAMPINGKESEPLDAAGVLLIVHTKQVCQA